MTPRTKIRIAHLVCVLSFTASVVMTFTYPPSAAIFLGIGLYSGVRAAKWKKEVVPDKTRSMARISPPRRSFFYRLIVGSGWFFFILLTIACLGWGGLRLYYWHLYRTEGISVPGSVIGMERHVGRRHESHYLTYQYSDGSNASYRVHTSVDAQTWDGLNKGDPVPIKYLPGQPQSGRLDIDSENKAEAVGAIVTLLIGVIFSIGGIRQFSHSRGKAT